MSPLLKNSKTHHQILKASKRLPPLPQEDQTNTLQKMAVIDLVM